jgi:PAS domain S-box-containing protein
MTDKEKKGNLLYRLKFYSWVLVFLWTGCIVASLLWNLYEEREKILNIARNSAQITFENDVLYRRWAAMQGGVYVPVSKHTPPNPYLNVPDQDVTTSSGLSLTLVNPAYMARQVNQMAVDIRGSQGHITSLNPVRPENAPDSWEAAALKSFERGIKEVSSVEKIAGQEHMRLMRPFVAEKACLKCHASQGYKGGDIRGGISVSIPMAPLWAIERPLIAGMSLAHLLLWILGIAGIVISKKGLERQILGRERAEAVLKQEKDFMESLIKTATDAIVSADHEGKILLWNPAAGKIFGYTPAEAAGHKLEELIVPDFSRSRFKEALSDGFSKGMELELKKKDAAQFPAEISFSSGERAGESAIRSFIVKDISERQRAEKALKESANTLRIVADFTYDWEYWRSPDGPFLYVSPSCERITGYTREEFMQDPGLLSRIIHPEDRERVTAHFREDLCRQELCELEFRIVRRDGQERWIGHACRLVLDEHGRSLGRRASDRDITERKRAEEALQQRTFELQQLTETLELRVQERTAELAKANEAARQLSKRLLSAQEDERKRLAGEIHDTFGASLTAIKFKVEDILQKTGKTPNAATESLNTIIPMIQEGVEECRRIQMDLRPSMLDDLGLLPTLSWFCRRFQAVYSGIRVEQGIDIQEHEVPNALKIVIYRVTQEAMNNIAKHSKADRVHLSLQKIDYRIELMLQDNGRGFDPEEAVSLESTKRGLGLTSMRERIELSGGFFDLESIEGKGTMIRASWPLNGKSSLKL